MNQATNNQNAGRYPASEAVRFMADLQMRLHSHCIFCGSENPQGLRLAFSTHADGRVEAPFPCDRLYQGYTGYLHGGVIAALMDSAMTNCLFAHDKVALTGELHVRFLKPVVVNRDVTVSARTLKSVPPLFYIEAYLHQSGQLMAKATGKFMEADDADVPLVQQPV